MLKKWSHYYSLSSFLDFSFSSTFFLFYPPLFPFSPSLFYLPHCSVCFSTCFVSLSLSLPLYLLRLAAPSLYLSFFLSHCPLSPFPPSSLINFLPLSPSLPSSRDMALPEPPSGRGPKEDSSVPSCQEMDVRRSGQVKGVPRREKCGGWLSQQCCEKRSTVRVTWHPWLALLWCHRGGLGLYTPRIQGHRVAVWHFDILGPYNNLSNVGMMIMVYSVYLPYISAK